MPTLRVLPGEIAWLPWSADAFSRARDERKPVLLCITATWSLSCREMDRTSYADPAIAFAINDGFVPVRVNADHRPDICDRYSLGGWPTTAFLTADGDMLGGGTYVEPQRLSGVLQQVRQAYGRAPASHRDSAVAVAPGDAGTPPDVESLCRAIFEAFDEEFGGFGAAPKFPHTAPIHLALARYRANGDERLESIVTRTLDAMGWGPLYDEDDGGFFRFAATRDWRQPHTEKLLTVNASLLHAYVAAADELKIARLGERAADIVRYVQTWLADVQDGGWYGSRCASGVVPGERSESVGVTDTAFYADGNACMASAMLRAASVFDDESLREFALKSLERVLLACYRPGHGVAHFTDGQARVRGLLPDQVAMATAQLDAFEATGNIVYEMMAEELAHYAIREMWDADAGGFFDRAVADAPDAVGLMRRRLKPFVANCEAARLLTRLAIASGDSEFTRFAAGALAAVAPQAAAQGPLAAHYVLAIE